MADTPETPTTPDGTPENPLTVTLVNPAAVPGGVVTPTPGIDETVDGGAYIVGGQWVNACGEPIKAPKGK